MHVRAARRSLGSAPSASKEPVKQQQAHSNPTLTHNKDWQNMIYLYSTNKEQNRLK